MNRCLFYYLFFESIITALIYFNFIIMLKFSETYEEYKNIFLIIFPSILIYSLILYFNIKNQINIVKKKGCKIILYLLGILLTLFIEWISFVEICIFGMNNIIYCKIQVFLLILIIIDFIILLCLKLKYVKLSKGKDYDDIENNKEEIKFELRYKSFKNLNLKENLEEENETKYKENFKVL